MVTALRDENILITKVRTTAITPVRNSNCMAQVTPQVKNKI